jgi:hypothetical protein
MLFDLRGAGRRRTVQAIYLSLAILMGGGLVLFGVGGNVGGGLLDAVKGGGGGSSGDVFAKRVRNLERQTRLQPTDATAWLQLARARFQDASVGDGYDQATGAYTTKGKAKLRGATQAWNRYLALNPKHPDPDVANLMVQAFGALNQLDAALAAKEVYVASQPKSAALYAQLAALAYQAGNTRIGDLSAQKAVALTPKAQRSTLRQQLDAIKTQAAQQAAQAATGAAGTPAPTP